MTTSELKRVRVYEAYRSMWSGFAYLTVHSEANDCDVPAPEGEYIRAEDFYALATHAERLEADLRSQGEELGRRYAEEADRLESARDSWRRINERLEAENKVLEEDLNRCQLECTEAHEEIARLRRRLAEWVKRLRWADGLTDVVEQMREEITND